jgi:DeoR/GlpR family transcriptional regulator of sugar metabolism
MRKLLHALFAMFRSNSSYDGSKLCPITNAVNISAELADTELEIILTGDTLRKNSFSLIGPVAEETLRRLNADILFLGVDGFHVQRGLSTPNLQEAKVNGLMIEIVKHTVAVCMRAIRTKEPFIDCANFRPPQGHNRPWHSKI